MSGYGPPRGWRGSNAWGAAPVQRPAEDAVSGDYVERLEAVLGHVLPGRRHAVAADALDFEDLRAALAELKQLRAQGTEYGIRADFTDTTSAEFTVADNLGDALRALDEFDAKHGQRVVSRELVQRPVGTWRKIGDDRG